MATRASGFRGVSGHQEAARSHLSASRYVAGALCAAAGSRRRGASGGFVRLQLTQDGGARRVVPRALGKWRGSTLPGYLTHDDITFRTNFR